MNEKEKLTQSNINWLSMIYLTPLTNHYKIMKN